ncbi:MAG: cytochrome c family protein, partial [Sphingomonadales bacterium]
MKHFAIPFAAASALVLAACSQTSEQTDAQIAAEESAAATTDDSAMTATPGATPPAATGTPPASTGGKTLALEGLGDL